MKFTDLNLYDFGNSIVLRGLIFGDSSDTAYMFGFPKENLKKKFVPVVLSLEDWNDLLRQTDEVLVPDPNSYLKKTFLRKSSRNIDTKVSWTCYRRDGFRCRYCHADDVPLTVDHIILWEDKGATVVENLITACQKCNRARGNMQYEDWIVSEMYNARRTQLPPEVHQQNLDTVAQLPHLRTLKAYVKKSR